MTLGAPTRTAAMLELAARAPLVHLVDDEQDVAVLLGLEAAGLLERREGGRRLTRRGRAALERRRDLARRRDDRGRELTPDDRVHLDGLHACPRRTFVLIGPPVLAAILLGVGLVALFLRFLAGWPWIEGAP